jgi:hypothetical protein
MRLPSDIHHRSIIKRQPQTLKDMTYLMSPSVAWAGLAMLQPTSQGRVSIARVCLLEWTWGWKAPHERGVRQNLGSGSWQSDKQSITVQALYSGHKTCLVFQVRQIRIACSQHGLLWSRTGLHFRIITRTLSDSKSIPYTYDEVMFWLGRLGKLWLSTRADKSVQYEQRKHKNNKVNVKLGQDLKKLGKW